MSIELMYKSYKLMKDQLYSNISSYVSIIEEDEFDDKIDDLNNIVYDIGESMSNYRTIYDTLYSACSEPSKTDFEVYETFKTIIEDHQTIRETLTNLKSTIEHIAINKKINLDRPSLLGGLLED